MVVNIALATYSQRRSNSTGTTRMEFLVGTSSLGSRGPVLKAPISHPIKCLAGLEHNGSNSATPADLTREAGHLGKRVKRFHGWEVSSAICLDRVALRLLP